MDFECDRRKLLTGASGAVAALMAPAWLNRAAAAPLTPERGLESYRRMLCGAEGEEVLWWFIGDIYSQAPGKSLLPVARSLTIGGYTAETSSDRAFRYRFREAGVIVDLASGEPMERNPLTQESIKAPLVDEPVETIDWAVQDDGNIRKTQHGRTSTLNLRWTETSANLLLIETEPGPNAFALAPGDSGSDWKALQSTRTVYAKRSSLARPGFVPAQMIYNVVVKATPPWLTSPAGGDRWLIVRGIGQKSRRKDVVNPDALALVRRFFPTFL